MGIDYIKSQFIGFTIDQNWDNNVSDFIREHIKGGLLMSVNNYDVLVFSSQEKNIEFGRLNEFITIDRFTGEQIYPKSYLKHLHPVDIKLTEKETIFVDRMTEYVPNFKLEHYEIAYISY